MGCVYDTNPAYGVHLSVVTPLPLPPIAPLPDVPSTDEAEYEDIQLETTIRAQSLDEYNDHEDAA